MKNITIKSILPLVILTMILSTSLVAQDFFIEATFPTTGLDRFSVCGGNRTITVKLTNTSSNTITNDTITFLLPAGFDYSSGSVTGGGVTEVDTTAPSFTFSSVAPSGVIEFSIDVEVLCEGVALATGSATSAFSINMIYTGGAGNQSYTSPFFEVVKPTLSISQIDGKNSTDPDPLNVAKFQQTISCVTLANGGNGPLGSFDYWIVDHPHIQIDSINIAGYGIVPATSTSGDTTFYTITSNMIAFASPYTGPGADANITNLFQFNETVEVCEYWNVYNCSLNSPDLERGMRYKCQATYGCEQNRALQGVRFGYSRPDLVIGWTDNYGDHRPLCMGDTLHYHGAFMTNVGGEAATDLMFSLYFGADNRGGMFPDTAEIYFSINKKDGPFFKHPIDYSYHPNYYYSPECMASAGYSGPNPPARQVSFFMDNTILMPGDTLYIKYGYRVGCACGDKNRNDCSRWERYRDFRRLIYGYYKPGTGGLNTGGSIRYKDGCEQFTYNDNYIQINGIGYYYNTIGEGEGSTLLDGESSRVTFQGTRNISTEAYSTSSSGFGCADCFLEYLYIFPEGLDWSGTNGDLNTPNWSFVDQDGTIWLPDSVMYTNNPTGLDTLRIRLVGPPPTGFWMNSNSLLHLDYIVDCSEVSCGFYSGVPIKEEAYFSLSGGICGTCGEEGDQIDCSESVPVTFQCPCNTGCDDGIVFKSLGVERRTFGEADNNNNTITETGETLDTTLLKLNRVIPGDTIRAIFKGEVRLTNYAGMEYAFAEIILPSSVNDFLPVGANVKIYDVSSGTVISCNVLQQFVDGQKIVTNLSSANLKMLGCTAIPANWQYENGDSIEVEVYFMTRNNLGWTPLSVVYNTRFYISDQDYGGTVYQCNPRDFLLTHIGYNFYHSRQSTYTMRGCNVAHLDLNHRMVIGSGWGHRNSPDFFPNEVRAPFKIGTTRFVKKSDLRFTERVLIRYYPKLVNNPGSRNVNFCDNFWIDFTNPYITVIADTVLIDVKGWVEGHLSGLSYDQGFQLQVYVETQANCNTELSNGYDKLYDYEINSTADSRVIGSPTYNAVYEDVADIRLLDKPTLAIQVSPKTKLTIENPACFTVDIVNAGDATANNVFVAFNDFNGSIVVDALYEISGNNQTLLTPTNFGLYQIGNLSSGKTKTFRLCVSTNNCDLDSMEIFTGWDCFAYPTSLQEAECGSSDKIYLLPVESELGMIITSPLTETTGALCDEIEYEIALSSADIGSLNDVNLWFLLPPKMTFVPGSLQLLYPVTGSYQTISAPTLSGSVYQINISEENATLASTGLPGTVNIGNNIFKVKLKVITECDYASGSRPKFLAFAYDPCGKFANYRFSPGPAHHLSGVSQPFASSISFQDVTLNACSEDKSAVSIGLNLASGSQPIGTGDSLRVVLPSGVRYVTNSYAAISNAVTSQPSIEIVNGDQIIYIDLLDGVTTGNFIEFTIEVEAFDVGQDCRSYDMIIQSFNSQNTNCSSNSANCAVRVISSETTRNITIEKPSYQITWNSSTVTPVTSSTSNLIYSVDLQNISSTGLAASTGVTVEIYKDIDGDGRFSAGDQLAGSSLFNVNIAALETITLSDTITVGTDVVCDLLAVINPQVTCACSEDETFLLDAEIVNAFTREQEICSNASINIGPSPVPSYTYEWFGINGADLTVLSATNTTPIQFSYDNNTGNDVVWEYVLRTVASANCYSYDTMKITIYKEIDQSVTTSTCVGFPVALNGPAGTVGSWTPTTNLIDPNSPTTGMTAITATTNYVWTYTDSKGCIAYYSQKVELAGCSPRTMIGNYVWRDDNRDGIQTVGEPPLFNVPVYLYDADNTSVPLVTTYTDANGYYAFKPIPSGLYRVGFGNPYDYDVSTQDAGSDEELDSDISTSSRTTNPILVSNGDSITTIDAGFMPMQKIGNYVWSDLDSNGIQDIGELPIQNVKVSLYSSTGTHLLDTYTDGNGAYQFRVEPAQYYIIFDASTNSSNINYVGVPKGAGADVTKDSDADGTSGKTDLFTVSAGADRLDIDASFNGVEACGNGVDDDSDGDTDCADTDCQPIIRSVMTIAPTCLGGGTNGQITITAEVASGTLSYSINNVASWQASNVFSNVGVGQYTIRVRNEAGCSATYVNNPVTFDMSTCVEICDDGIDNDGDGLVDCDDPDCDNIEMVDDIKENK